MSGIPLSPTKNLAILASVVLLDRYENTGGGSLRELLLLEPRETGPADAERGHGPEQDGGDDGGDEDFVL